jgi:integrase
MSKSNVIVLTPSTVKRTITPRRPPNAELRTREHLTDTEVEALIEVVKENRDGHRDALMMLLAYQHGLRAAEVVDLRWEQIDFKSATLHVRRLKNARRPLTPLLAGSCGRSDVTSARPRRPRSCSRRIGEHHLRPQAFPA